MLTSHPSMFLVTGSKRGGNFRAGADGVEVVEVVDGDCARADGAKTHSAARRPEMRGGVMGVDLVWSPIGALERAARSWSIEKLEAYGEAGLLLRIFKRTRRSPSWSASSLLRSAVSFFKNGQRWPSHPSVLSA